MLPHVTSIAAMPVAKARPKSRVASLIKLGLVVSLLAGSAAPAMAWGDKEQGFVAGVGTALLLGHLAGQGRDPRPAPPQFHEGPRYPAPHDGHGRPGYDRPQHGWDGPRDWAPAPRGDYRPAPQPPRSGVVHQGAMQSNAAQAFRSYSPRERRAIQHELARRGYYRGGVDGLYGPGTWRAVEAYARNTGSLRQLQSVGGAYAVYDGLLF